MTHRTTDALEALTALPNDPTGIDTFERFRWQAKLAVRSWLSTLGPNGPLAVVAEFLEDLVVVETDVFRFAQLKTRDRGSWSAAKICEPGHAVNSLVASYRAAEAAGLLDLSQFEVWLEGPPASDPKTKAFFARPADADAGIRGRIRDMGLRGAALANFLDRLKVICHQPSRQTIDAVVIKAIGAAWPHLQFRQVSLLYEQLLDVATAAQTASEPPAVVRAALCAGRLDPADAAIWAPIQSQALLREHLRALCPPLGAASNEELLERAAAGEATLLELKLVRAGASPTTVGKAIGARADASVAVTLALSGGRANEGDIEALDKRILAMADSVAILARLGEPSAPAPAEHVFHSLMSRPSDVCSTDTSGILDGDHRLVIGHLCELSDQCRYGWGRP